jgi:hypothetical protein
MEVCFKIHAKFQAYNRAASFNPATLHCTKHRQTFVVLVTEIPDRIFIFTPSQGGSFSKKQDRASVLRKRGSKLLENGPLGVGLKDQSSLGCQSSENCQISKISK